MNTVILLFHPNMRRSLVNKRLIEAAQAKRGVNVRDMYALYGDEPINPEMEHHILERAKRIVLQFPLEWYNAPALFHKWAKQVLDDYWLHSGPDGREILQGKELLLTVAYSEPSYDFTANGKYKYSLKEILRPFEVLSMHLGLKYCEPFTIYELDDLTKAAKEYADLLVKEELPEQPLHAQ